MAVSLIVPCAGKSSRYGYDKPKWALTHPSGKLMVEEALSGIDFDSVSCVYFAFLREHEISLKRDLKELVNQFDLPVRVEAVVIDESDSQVTTVCQVIRHFDIVGAIAIKDCDNYFRWKPEDKNSVACKKISQDEDIRFLQQKSFIRDIDGFEIIEKKLVSDTFCVGGYSFKDSVGFVIDSLESESEYLSQVINYIHNEKFDKPLFQVDYVDDYSDWGNKESWQEYRSNFKTLFIDIDGVILENGSGYFEPRWEYTEPIKKNIDFINSLKNSHVVLTTARPERLREATRILLGRYGLKYNHLIMGLPHAKRYLINDFSDSNPYPAAISLNLRRNSDKLAELLS